MRRGHPSTSKPPGKAREELLQVRTQRPLQGLGPPQATPPVAAT